jgi:excisionase family DNA binding protein
LPRPCSQHTYFTAERIGVSDQTIYNWIADGTMQGYRMRGMKRKRYTIPMGEVERLRRAYEEIVEGNSNGLAVAA